MKIEPTREWSESWIEKEGATEIGAGVPLRFHENTYPALHRKLDYFELSVSRARSPDGTKDGYMAYIQPAFGASSGISHKVWSETMMRAINEMERILENER